jgi:hypothetical protein
MSAVADTRRGLAPRTAIRTIARAALVSKPILIAAGICPTAIAPAGCCMHVHAAQTRRMQ